MNSVTITLAEDGSYTIEGQAGAAQAKTPEEACHVAMQMLGTPENEAAEGSHGGEGDFEAGFAGVRGG